MILLWVGFLLLVFLFLALDLGVFNRTAHVISSKEALAWTAVWICVSMAFNALVYPMYNQHWLGVGLEAGHELNGAEAAIRFFTAYLVEKSLSLDNIFVIALIFAYFRVPAKDQHRVLFWGVLGALILRGAMIGGGIAFIRRFEWLVYVFGALLIFTSLKMLVMRDDKFDPERSLFFRIIQRWFPLTEEFHGRRFFVKLDGKWAATPMAVTLVIVETSDLLFAFDSIPAVFAITLDPFIVFTSNVFAILGLRSLYFALAAVMGRFRYLKISLVLVLAFVGTKMLLSHYFPIDQLVSLAVISGLLLAGVVASAFGGPKGPEPVAAETSPSNP